MRDQGLFFFPLADKSQAGAIDIEGAILSRRIPDFLCLCLNEASDADKIGLLEIRSADEEGYPTGEWAEFDEMPEIEDAMALLPQEGLEAVILGSIEDARRGLLIKLQVVQEGAVRQITEIRHRLDPTRVVDSLLALCKKLARHLGLPFHPKNWDKLGTPNDRAMAHFLLGLEGASSLDPQIIGLREPRTLLEPFVQALEQDPEFGWALRKLHWAIVEGLGEFTVTTDEALALYDGALETWPADAELMAQIGEFLASIDEDEQAEEWLRQSVERDNPPIGALEFLGILLANRGEMLQARNLWLAGVKLDGHPDFFAHLARLAFSESQWDEAWDKVIRGLRRLSERRLHPGEWDEDEGRGGVLLRYLAEHLADLEEKVTPPEDIGGILLDLCELTWEPEDRMNLGICLTLTGHETEALQALHAALPHVEDLDRRDIGAEMLCELVFEEFDQEFAQSVDTLEEGGDLETVADYLSKVCDSVPQFWPAWFFLGKTHEVRESWEAALNAYERAAFLRRDQSEIFSRVALCAHQCAMSEKAIASLDKAIEIEPHDAGLHADKALLLHIEGHKTEALEALDTAETLDPDLDAVQRVRALLLGKNINVEPQ